MAEIIAAGNHKSRKDPHSYWTCPTALRMILEYGTSPQNDWAVKTMLAGSEEKISWSICLFNFLWQPLCSEILHYPV
ncbi:MAG: hypothetical protein ACTS77_00785 [Arsenophonus sp. NC-TX2-MAG3]